MRIAIDISPLTGKQVLGHRVRGTGFYLENLKKSLLEYFSQNEYIFFSRGESLPKDIDIVHYPYFEPFFPTLPFNKVGKMIVTVHDLTPFVFPKYFSPGIKGTFMWLLQKRALRMADAIITDSNSSKKDIHKFTGIPNEKITVVYLAAGEEFKKLKMSESEIKGLRKKYNLPKKFALYVGDVTWNKNLPRLTHAIKQTNIPLVMVGKALVSRDFDGTNAWNQDLSMIQKLVKNDKQFILLGFVSKDELVSLYNMATVFIMPSLYEGFGLPVLEAMQCGCPVVTTREGSLPEVGGDGAFYVDAYNIDSIANGLTEVFFDKSLQSKLSQNGLKQARLFSWEKTTAQTVDVYEALSRK